MLCIFSIIHLDFQTAYKLNCFLSWCHLKCYWCKCGCLFCMYVKFVMYCIIILCQLFCYVTIYSVYIRCVLYILMYIYMYIFVCMGFFVAYVCHDYLIINKLEVCSHSILPLKCVRIKTNIITVSNITIICIRFKQTHFNPIFKAGE